MIDKNEMREISKSFNQVMKHLEDDQEKFWDSLSKEDQLKAFCAVSRRIYKGEIENRGSYRYVLYQVFGFGSESYVQAQMAGYLAIHNAIVSEDHDTKLLRAFCEKNSIEDMENKIQEFSVL